MRIFRAFEIFTVLVKTSNEDTDFDDFIVGIGGGYSCKYPQAK